MEKQDKTQVQQAVNNKLITVPMKHVLSDDLFSVSYIFIIVYYFDKAYFRYLFMYIFTNGLLWVHVLGECVMKGGIYSKNVLTTKILTVLNV